MWAPKLQVYRYWFGLAELLLVQLAVGEPSRWQDWDMPKIPPLALVAGAAAIQLALARGSKSTRCSRLGALVLAGTSAWLLGSSLWQFRTKETTVNPIDVEQVSSLVESGPFQASRNPMYLGMAGLLLAHAVGRRSWLSLLPMAGFVAVIDRYQIPPEEQALRAKFGKEFDDYARRVPRWLGLN